MDKKIKKALKGKVKREAAKQTGKAARKALKFIPFKYQAVILGVVLAAGIGFSLIPEGRVPEFLEQPHTTALTLRNKLIRMSGLPISRYEDQYSIENPASDPIRLYLAPSPVIAPALRDFIRSAVHTVDVCAFDIKLDEIADALIEVNKNGIQVRVVTETNYESNAALQRIKQAGIPVVSDHKSGLMHNKFVIVDSRYLWTGSFNLTPNGKNRNDNNAVLIESPTVAEGYKARFEQYFSGKFGKSGKPSVRSVGFIGNMQVRYAFSPVDKVSAIVLQELSKATKTVDVMAFSFTGAEFAAKLRELHKLGVKIRVLFDYGQAKNKASRDEYLRKVGVKVFYSPNRVGKMHHKVFIIDKKTVITGSFNFSRNAESHNDENILILRSEKIADIYTREMNRCIKGTKGY